MSFTSLLFVTVFIPVFTTIYYIIQGNKYRNIWLLTGSLIFYSFGGINYLVLLVLMASWSCFIAGRIQRSINLAEKSSPGFQDGDEEFMNPSEHDAYEKSKRAAKIWLLIGVIVLAVVLITFKYMGFIINSTSIMPKIDKFREGIISMGMPIGISFYTFKLISYISDVYRRKTKSGNLFNVMLYTVVFHQVSQGPIVRYDTMASQFKNRSFSWEGTSNGIARFCLGLAKKTILADHCGKLAGMFLPITAGASYSVGGAYIGSLCYMLQLYIDFSAYSDMAIGLGQMVGFNYPENFNYPYAATSVRDFWKRWHISLSTFFRDYVYIPLGGNRVGFMRLILNLLVVWLLTGIWHGASSNFILWGLYYFVFIVIENLVHKFIRFPQCTGVIGIILNVCCRVYTIVIVYFGWVLFRISDFTSLSEVVKVMAGMSDRELFSTSEALMLRGNMYFLIASLTVCTPLWKYLAEKINAVLMHSFKKEAREIQNLENENSLYKQETTKDQVLVEKYGQNNGDILKEVREQDIQNHEKMLSRLENRLRKRKSERARIEAVYYGVRTLLILFFLFVSILSMVGASYTPFLYNQF
ncbi:MBOAT family O-acyltransferase [Oribacterium sp. WCC10]|uniref:MBOAT family O-acyltransferase n=1 Tax=Oribacterium sp. WCC10 TaxID=1855343 RepID=UPI0008EB2F27|nr:MBOAT family O-acyltransferase [Oribacterium sp. WCC10]SFG12933.1 alginate O-acetyltransferase complex protein AlgI [Oribacterium sp. WCC10]